MQSIRQGRSGPATSRLAYGCMRIEGAAGKAAVRAAIDAGFSLFDHADIYNGGASEQLFGELLRESPNLRERIVIQSKCGIRLTNDRGAPARYDFSHDYIIASVEGSLQRLGVESLDLLLLHRPDYLMAAAEVAQAVAELQSAGKIIHFGVSNFSASQVELLQAALDTPIAVNQVEINLHNIDALQNGVLDQCQRLQISPQAWCPLAAVAYPAWGNTFSGADEVRLGAELERQSQRYGQDPWLIALAWLLRHPARISPIIGSTTPARIAAAPAALHIDYSREDWYRLLEARKGRAVP